jgi:prepilin-type processing-associated H-X9-DG protein
MIYATYGQTAPSKTKGYETAFKVFTCPSDTKKRWSGYGSDFYPLSYFINNGTKLFKSPTALAWPRDGKIARKWSSRRLSEVKSPGSTFLLVEMVPDDDSTTAYTVVGDPQDWLSSSYNFFNMPSWNRDVIYPGLGAYKHNLLFVDGSVALKVINHTSNGINSFSEDMEAP